MKSLLEGLFSKEISFYKSGKPWKIGEMLVKSGRSWNLFLDADLFVLKNFSGKDILLHFSLSLWRTRNKIYIFVF